jgi:hypothetical protein
MEKEIKSYALIKIPVKVENLSKASDLLGDKKDLYNKIKSGQDIDFDFFYNKLPLENCFSNDILLKRKTYRNKKDKTKKKYKYFIMGKITNIMQAFALENFIYINEEKTSLNDIGKYLIKKEEYDKEEIKPNEEGKVISNLIKKKYKEINSINENEQEENVENFFKYIQPINFANFKNSSQNVPKILKNKFNSEEFNEG